MTPFCKTSTFAIWGFLFKKMKHFKLTTESKVNAFGITLFRVELIINCKWGSSGDKGGWVEKEENISGNAWVYGNAEVHGNSEVSGDALVSGNARVYGNAEVHGNAEVSGDDWEKSTLQIQGTFNFLNVYKKGFLKIGCKEFSLEFWKENFEKIGKENGYTDEQIIEYGLYIDLAIKLSEQK